MAIVCRDAAEKFVKSSDEFEIIGPLMTNTDIIIESGTVKSIGLTQNKNYLKKYLKKKYGDIKFEFMLPHTLPYAYESGEVDAIVLDLFDVVPGLKGVFRQVDENYFSNVLVINEKIAKDKKYIEFIERYNEFVEKYNNSKNNFNLLDNNKLDRRLDKFWKLRLVKVK